MKIKSAESAAFIIATTMCIFSVGGAVIDFAVAKGPWEWYYLSYSSGVFVGGYFISRYVIRKFILYRIKPIYQVAISRDVKIRELENNLVNRANMLDDIGIQVTSWADTNREEIERLKGNELYHKEFLGNVSHELKTPIFNIQGYVNTLLDGGLEDGRINREYLERTEKNIERLINIVKDLSEINTLESSKLQLRMEDFDIVALCRYIIENVEYGAAEKSIKIVFDDANPEPIRVNADKWYIEQVLMNLIVNSIHYGNTGGTTTISFIDMFDKIMVEVADDGIGISQEDLPHIFERFYRVDKSRSRTEGGTGLGLAIVRHVINAHKEGLSVRSKPGVGTTFSFTVAKAVDKHLPK